MKDTRAMEAGQRFEHAFALHGNGRHAEAFALYETILAADPLHAAALHFSGLLLHEAGKYDDAIARIERALEIDDRPADVWSNLALVYMAAGRADHAMRALEAALKREPTLGVAWLNLASLRLQSDDAIGAEDAARRALSCSDKRDENPQAWFNLALALAAQARAGEALAALDRVDAVGAVADDDAAVPGLRAQLLIALDRRDDARAVLDRALARIDHPVLRIERARLADARRDMAAAIADYRAALLIAPDEQTTLSDLVFLKKRVADWKGLGELQSRFRDGVLKLADRVDQASALTPFSFLSDPSTRAEQRIAGEAWSRRWVAIEPRPTRLSAGRGDRNGRLRIGYLSADLHEHATGVLTVGLFEQHDRAAFEVFGYSTGPDDGSALRRRIVAGFDRFVDAQGWEAGRIAQTIRADGIDILVDLKGHTERAPTAVMALRPAPIQVSYLGYPATMGAPFIDYLIGDAIVTPFAHQADYSETLVQLPGCYQINDDRRVIGATPDRKALGLPDEGFVFCCFNNVYKIGPDVFDAWMRILRDVPRSVLWLLTRADDEFTRNNLRREAMVRGIDPSRVVFADTRPHAEYLALYRHADLFLDTWPYNAHTTASDALWVGCPVLTTIGDTFAGRVAASLLSAVGMLELIASGHGRYVATAIETASDRARSRALRERLQASVGSSSLFDTTLTTRAIEAAYRAMADQYRNGKREPISLLND